MTAALLILGGYLLGAVPFAYLVGRALRRIDIRTVGSGNAGATNVLRCVGPGPALAVLALDVGKGALPVAAAQVLGASAEIVTATGLAAVLGHLFPVYLGFRGGKGMATAAGVLAVLAPLPVLAAAGLFLALVLWTRWVSLGSVVAVVAVPVLLVVFPSLGWTESAPAAVLVLAVLVALAVIASHTENVKRLVAGREPRIDLLRGSGGRTS